VIFVRRVARYQYLYVIQISTLVPQLNPEASTYSRPLLGSWTVLLRRIVPTILPPFSLSGNSPIGLPRAGNYRFAESDPDRHQRGDISAIQTQHIEPWIPINDSTNHISCSSLPFLIAGTTNDDSNCSIARKTHSPPLEPVRVVYPKRAVT